MLPYRGSGRFITAVLATGLLSLFASPARADAPGGFVGASALVNTDGFSLTEGTNFAVDGVLEVNDWVTIQGRVTEDSIRVGPVFTYEIGNFEIGLGGGISGEEEDYFSDGQDDFFDSSQITVFGRVYAAVSVWKDQGVFIITADAIDGGIEGSIGAGVQIR